MSVDEKKLPTLFVGHGSPMNAIQDNAFTQSLRNLGAQLQTPQAILCVSAHWCTKGTWITHMQKPRTIHDFYGFPDPLYQIDYSAEGSLELAELISHSIHTPTLGLDDGNWGLDHGSWSVLRHLYPLANIPVLQLSIDLSKPPEYHLDLGRKLAQFRTQGVLILGSGNLVHNLRKIDFSPAAKPLDWAVEFDEWVRQRLIDRDWDTLIHQATRTRAGQLSIPTLDHWYPLLYVLGASEPEEALRFEYEGIDHGSISMRSFSLGRS